MFDTVLPPGAKSALALLKDTAQDFYLAGGTGLALQLGHRVSGDLDFFSTGDFDPGGLRDRLAGAGNFTLVSEARGTLHCLLQETKVSFLHYPYPLLFPTALLEGVAVAGVRDIALMKITAISSRGGKKDFIDLFFACRTYSLTTLLDWFPRKYHAANYSRYHILKSLTYFEDAEMEPDPIMLQPWSWAEVKAFFIAEAVKVARDLGD